MKMLVGRGSLPLLVLASQNEQNGAVGSPMLASVVPLVPVGPSATAKPPDHAAPAVPSASSSSAPVAAPSSGLSTANADLLRQQWGWNESVVPKPSKLRMFLMKFWGPVPFILELTGIIAILLAKYDDAALVFVLLVINGCVAFVEEVHSDSALDALRAKLQLQTRVKRDGQWQAMPARVLVPGDLIRVRMGDILPADVNLCPSETEIKGVAHDQTALELDESALTGETSTFERRAGESARAGAIVRRGEMLAVVMNTGPRTLFGGSTTLLAHSKPVLHMTGVMSRVVGVEMGGVILVLIATLIVMAARGDDILEIVPLMLLLLMMGLPVALPAMTTISMAVGSKDLSDRGVLITRLDATSDASSMSIFCCDKTGTMTKNELAVSDVAVLAASPIPGLDVLSTAALCSREENKDSIDHAVLTASKAQNAPSDVLRKLTAVKFMPFDATRRRTEAVLHNTETNEIFRVMKGAYATLVNLANVSADQRSKLMAVTDSHAARGFRSIAVACSAPLSLPPATTPQAMESSMVALSAAPLSVIGILGLYDPPREDSASVVDALHKLGIRVLMLTGDNYKVAAYVGREIGIGTRVVNFDERVTIARAQLQKERTAAVPQAQPSLATPVAIVSTKNASSLNPAEPTSKRSQFFSPIGAARHRHFSFPPRGIEPAKPELPKDAEEKAHGQPHLTMVVVRPVTAQASLEDTARRVALESIDLNSTDVIAQLLPSDKHAIVGRLQALGLVVGMTGDGVNDAPALKQAEVGVAVHNATDVAKASASSILTVSSLRPVLQLVETGRLVHTRLESWLLNKIAKTMTSALFITIVYLVTARFVLKSLHLILQVLLIDFVTLCLSVDRIDVSNTGPLLWQVHRLAIIGFIIGPMCVAEAIGLLYALQAIPAVSLKFDQPQFAVCGFLILFVLAKFTTLSMRERNHFYHSRPHWLLLTMIIVQTVVMVPIAAAAGVPVPDDIGWAAAGIILSWVVVSTLFVNDMVKVALRRYFGV